MKNFVTTSDGSQIYFEDRGPEKPQGILVFVYGIACVMNHWHHQIEYFEKTHRVITYDLRGHQQSTHESGPENLTIARLAVDLIELMAALEIKKADFLGHSFAAPLLISAYDQKPELFKSITLVNGFARNPARGMFGVNWVESAFHLLRDQYKKNPAVVQKIWETSTSNPLTPFILGFVGGFNLKFTQLKDIEIYARGVSKMSFEVFLPLFEEMMKNDYRKEAAKISVPTLIFGGDRDFVTPLRHQRELLSLITGSELVVVPYGSHCVQLDFPDFVNLKIEKFLSTRSP